VWRAQSIASLAYLGYLGWGLFSSAYYVSKLYGGVGGAVAGALVFAVLPVVLLTVPTACWGLSRTAPFGLKWPARAAGVVLVLGSAVGMVRASRAAELERVGSPVTSSKELAERLKPLVTGTPGPAGSLHTVEPVTCPETVG